jgi:hypothetical protein
MTQQLHPNSIAAQWKPGQSGNPKGRPNIGASIVEWFNVLQEKPPTELRAILADRDTQPTNKVIAAAQLLRAIENLGKGGDMGGTDLERVLDRALGKPVQATVTATVVTHKVYIPPAVPPGVKAEAVLGKLPEGAQVIDVDDGNGGTNQQVIMDPTDVL